MQKKTLRRVLIAAILLIVPLALLCFAFLLPPQYDETYLAALRDKTGRLKTAEGPRIILVGGSGAAFDVRSDLLEQELPGYTVVNCGLYAGLGTTVMLDIVEPYLIEGDIVVFMPEQSEQTLSTYFNAEALWQAADGSFPPLLSLNGKQREAMIGAFPRYAASKARLFLTGEKPHGDGVYARSSFNAYGDIASEGREQNRMASGFDPNMLISFDRLPEQDFLSRVNSFFASCRKKGASLYYGFCPMNDMAIAEDALSGAAAYTEELSGQLDCPLLGSAEDAVMDAGWFFDTNFHLNEAGQTAYTARLAALLKKAVGDTSPVSIEVPSMPSFASVPVYDGDNSDDVCFLYERAGDGYRITGLSDQWKAREMLTVPALHEGLPVRGFTGAVFSGNRTVRTVIICRNIVSIPDKSFSGCTSLEQIVLTNPAPETCSVGQHLLDGTGAVIAVPEGAYSAYATNYFWSPYAARIAH